MCAKKISGISSYYTLSSNYSWNYTAQRLQGVSINFAK